MKAFYFVIFSIFCCINSAFGQETKPISGWYIEPSLGYHGLKIAFSEGSYFSFGNRDYKSSLVVGGKIGRQFGTGFNIQLGLTLIPKGFTATNLNIPPLTEEGVVADVELNYSTIHFPLLLGYQINFSEELALRPTAGLIFGTSFGHDFKENVTNPPFRNVEPALVNFDSFNVGFTGEFSLIYQLKEKISLVLSGNFMKNAEKIEVFPDGGQRQTQRPTLNSQGFYFTLGTRIGL